MTTTLVQASQQWMSRPSDERFTSLIDMQEVTRKRFAKSRQIVVSSRGIQFLPDEDDRSHRGLRMEIDEGRAQTTVAPTHLSFSQLCSLASPGESPAQYFRKSGLPAPIIADALNFNLKFTRQPQEIGTLSTGQELRAATGPRYGRIWDYQVVDALVDRFGDGVSGSWRVPGEFGKAVQVTKANTTLYASDRDMFVFLADEENRIEIPGRREGQSGSFARGFFMWNSETGDKTLGMGFFLFDYVCCNRIVWGADQYTEVRIRHAVTAPDRWEEELIPVLDEYHNGSAKPVVQAIEDARAKRLDDGLDAFLANRFGKSMVPALKAIHETEEGRPIETVWDATVAATAHARSIPNTDKRVELERAAGELLKLAA